MLVRKNVGSYMASIFRIRNLERNPVISYGPKLMSSSLAHNMPPQINFLSFQLHISPLVVLNISCLQIKTECRTEIDECFCSKSVRWIAVFKSKISTENQHTTAIESNHKNVNKKSIYFLHGKLDF